MKNLFLIGFFIVLLIGVTLTVLTNIGGNSDVLKASLENYIANALQGQATIETLNDVQYFPKVIVDFENASLMRPNIKDPVFKVGRLQIATDFWNISLGNAELDVLNAKNIYAQSGVFTKKELFLKRLGIVDEKIDDPAFLFLDGKYGGRPFEGRIGMDRLGKGSPYKYKLAQSMDITLDSKALSINGNLSRKSERKMQIKNLEVRISEKSTLTKSLSGDILFQLSSSQENLYLEGDLLLGKNTVLYPDLKITLNTKPNIITGRIIAKNLDINDLSALSHIAREIKNFTSFENVTQTKIEDMNWEGVEMDIILEIPSRAFTTQIKITNGHLDLGTLKNEIE